MRARSGGIISAASSTPTPERKARPHPSELVVAALPSYAALAAGSALAVRHVAEILLGPVGGALVQKLTLRSVASAAGLAVSC
jgi:hypothetical protein